MRVDVLTLFPAMFDGVLGESILKRARDAGVLDVRLTNFRDYAEGRHKKVDDTAYGGGPGMVLKCEPVFSAVRAVLGDDQDAHLVLLTPQGKTLTQNKVRELAGKRRIVMLCGHYEGYDERIRQGFPWDEISIGDYVLTGGELAAMVVIDAVARLLPGTLGDETSATEESFEQGLLEYPQYTRPPVYEGMAIPDILLSGHHEEIAKWRRRMAEERTRERRPDLWRQYMDGGAQG
ncbi:MAG: tRNA (guanosine(37)-N1)-methyltransferase TrmD [Planctomycetes bacterium]|nr:tRNA (guanosine(37)-N1)-methyltransferase TrmD [Planctomycetota bacterium]NUQ34686.1 tRNA (guanosine(37)-N1)-methyltransferase TrmD [Planctomycetaceae bacterium]